MAFNFINKKPRYSGSQTGSVAASAPTPQRIAGLVATNLTTGLLNTSAVVSKSGTLAQTIPLADVSFWYVTGDRLEIFSLDSTPLSLSFTNINEAATAELRFTGMMNGSSY